MDYFMFTHAKQRHQEMIEAVTKENYAQRVGLVQPSVIQRIIKWIKGRNGLDKNRPSGTTQVYSR